MTSIKFCIFFIAFSYFSFAKHPDCFRNTMEQIKARGYPAENHTIITEDVYILSTFRIPGRRGSSYSHGQPVLIFHGVLGSSDMMIANGDDSIPYILADTVFFITIYHPFWSKMRVKPLPKYGNGFDVWIMSNRGTRYSRKHLILDPDKDARFWAYSLHELGIYDIKNNIEYIVKNTGFEKVAYIGYSQGSGAMLAGLAERPDFYKEHLKSVVLWAPVSNMEHSNVLMHILYSSYILSALDFLGLSELFPYDPALCSFTSVLCKLNPAICNMALALIADVILFKQFLYVSRNLEFSIRFFN